MNITQEKLDEFQGRMSNWVASQGLLFQLTHGGSIRGSHSSVVRWFIRMLLRLLMLGVVALVILWGYLVKRVDFSGFRANLNESIASGLGADETTAGGIKRARGHLEIARMGVVGGEKSFFEPYFETRDDGTEMPNSIRGLRTKMGLLDGVIGPWAGELISIEELNIRLRAGAETDAAGGEMFASLFSESAKFKFSRLEVTRATIRWGYSEVTRGEIEDATLQAVRRDGGWSLVVTGGTFSQNWLKALEIERMEVAITPGGVEISKATLKQGNGELVFTARVEGPATSPSLSGSGTIQGVSMDPFLNPELREFVGAEVSGQFEIGGSPYASTGVTMRADIELQDQDVVELRNRLPLFKAISVVDRGRSYRNVRFTRGGFKLETGERVAVFTDVALEANDLVTLDNKDVIEVPVMRVEGEFLVRRPTKEEVDEALRFEREWKPREAAAESEEGGEDLELEEPKELTLREAAEAARGEGGEEHSIDNLLQNAQLKSGEAGRFKDDARVREEARAREERTAPRLDGTLRIGLTAKAFERAPALVAAYPIDSENGFRWLTLPLKGNIFRVDSALADRILKLSESDRP